MNLTENYELVATWIDKEVMVKFKRGDEECSVRCVLRAAHPQTILVRPKGLPESDMIDTKNVLDIELFEVAPKPIKTKMMREPRFGTIRQHLADQHGIALDDLNAVGFSEEKAYDLHENEHAPGSPAMSHAHQ